MGRGSLPALAALSVADGPGTWRALGFAVGDDGACVVGGVRLDLVGPGEGEGITGWALRSDEPLPAAIDGIPTRSLTPDAAPSPGPAHPNGALGIDHVVVSTPDLPRTLAALEGAGLEVRRVREASGDLHQAFLWAGDVPVEVAGPPVATGDAPAALWGLVVVAADLEPFRALPGGRFGEARPAVQPGRWIAPATEASGTSTRLAVMTPHRPG